MSFIREWVHVCQYKTFRTASHLIFPVPSPWCPLSFCPLSPSPSHSLCGHCPAPIPGFWIGPIEKAWVLWPQSLGSLSPPPPLIGAQQVSFSGFRPRLLSAWPSLKASDSSKCLPGLWRPLSLLLPTCDFVIAFLLEHLQVIPWAECLQSLLGPWINKEFFLNVFEFHLGF